MYARISLALALAFPFGALAQQPQSFTVSGDQFLLNGKPFQIISGSIHYERIPRAYWRDRLEKARAMGLNTIETYVFWNKQEPIRGKFDFSGQNDVAEFVREAKEEGLYVVLRPGPYACAEWEWGGFPSWLLSDPHMVVRSSYPGFIQAAQQYLDAVGKQLAPLQIGNGGPILAVQVENEYGSYGNDRHYMEQIHQAIVHAGFTKSLLYTADGASEMPNDSLPELPAAVNFGTGDAQRSFAIYDKLRPGSIHFNSEYWDGWFDHWGAKHETRSAAQQLADLKWMLGRGYSVNLYMFVGGTSFGWMNGANSDKGDYEPDVTSYDYDVPIAEDGSVRPKFFAFRKAIEAVTHKVPPPLPQPLPPPLATGPIELKQSASLWSNLAQPVHSDEPRTMEEVGQSYGYILYRTVLQNAKPGTLTLPSMHDYAMVYVDGVFQGAIDRRLNQHSLDIQPKSATAKLDILVENTGRVNFGKALPGERTGLLAAPTLNGTALHGWDTISLPMLNPDSLQYTGEPCSGPCFYRASFPVDKPADIYLNTSQLGKGEVWINGIPLGRFWSIGPQKTLYLPGPWLHTGENQIVVFDLAGAPGRSVEGVSAMILDGTPSTDPLSAKAH